MEFAKKLKQTYLGFFDRTKFLSKFGSFAVAIITFLSLYDLFHSIFTGLPEEFWKESGTYVVLAVVFHVGIGVMFLTRFIFLFSASKRSGAYTHLFWLLGLAGISLYTLSTGTTPFGDQGDCMDCFYYHTFRYSSWTFTTVALFYLDLTILKFILLGIISIASVIFNRQYK